MKGSVRVRGDKYSYYFKYKDSLGKWKTKEKSGFTTKKEANAALRKAISEFEETGYMLEAKKFTVEELIEYWFENVAELTLKPRTIELYQEVKRLHINPEIGHLLIDKVTPDILQRLFTRKLKILSQGRVASIKALLNNVFTLAVKQKLVRMNPVKMVEFSAKREKSTTTSISRDGLKVLEEALEGTKYFTPYMIGLHTGMRRGEILGLTWENVNFDDNTITINHQLQRQENKGVVIETPKTPTSVRTFQMTSKLREYLLIEKEIFLKNKKYYGEHYYDGLNFVCRNPDGSPITPASLTCKMNHLKRKLGINFKIHQLRHTHATMMLEADANIKVVQERLGHSDIKTTLNIYSHVTKKLEDDSIKKFDELFE